MLYAHTPTDYFEVLTSEKANQRDEFPWDEKGRFAELQLYSMHLCRRSAGAPKGPPGVSQV